MDSPNLSEGPDVPSLRCRQVFLRQQLQVQTPWPVAEHESLLWDARPADAVRTVNDDEPLALWQPDDDEPRHAEHGLLSIQ